MYFKSIHVNSDTSGVVVCPNKPHWKCLDWMTVLPTHSHKRTGQLWDPVCLWLFLTRSHGLGGSQPSVHINWEVWNEKTLQPLPVLPASCVVCIFGNESALKKKKRKKGTPSPLMFFCGVLVKSCALRPKGESALILQVGLCSPLHLCLEACGTAAQNVGMWAGCRQDDKKHHLSHRF